MKTIGAIIIAIMLNMGIVYAQDQLYCETVLAKIATQYQEWSKFLNNCQKIDRVQLTKDDIAELDDMFDVVLFLQGDAVAALMVISMLFIDSTSPFIQKNLEASEALELLELLEDKEILKLKKYVFMQLAQKTVHELIQLYEKSMLYLLTRALTDTAQDEDENRNDIFQDIFNDMHSFIITLSIGCDKEIFLKKDIMSVYNYKVCDSL